MKKKIILVVLLSLLLAASLLFVFASKEDLVAQLLPTAPTYQISFRLGLDTVSQQTLEEGALPQPPTALPEGVQVLGWCDEAGQLVDPFTIPAAADTVYHADFQPQLTQHVPFLFADDEGLLQPDAPLSAEALAQALKALAAPGAFNYFPQLPQEGMLTTPQLTEVLGHFFSSEAVAAAFPADTELTRTAFAAGMLTLQQRQETPPALLPERFYVPEDITALREDAVTLLEACVPHTHEEGGFGWEALDLPTGYQPGFINLEGWLYYVRQDGRFLRDDYVDGLYFGADGRYSCGDAALDETVAATLLQMMEENPEADRTALLRIVYDYCHQTFTYRRTFDHPEYGTTGWEIQRAKDTFETGKGNCYNYSAVFWALTRGLGYPTRAISGKCLDDEQPHSWCIINLDGEDYFFDPQWQYAYTERNIFHYDMFQLSLEEAAFWQYQWSEE